MSATYSVSVIIPVYNVSKYIEKCARSVFEQSLDNMEIIFVNDCSSDNSVEIIENTLNNFPNRQAQTRIISLPANTGQGGVRRRGIIEATGDYVIHLDGDDWVDKELYKTMYDCAVNTGADIVMCGEKYEYPDLTKTYECIKMPDNGKDVMREWYRDTIGMFCHDKLVRRTLYTDNNILPWEGLNMWEDNGLMSRLFYFSKKLEVVQGVFYHYNRCNVNAMTAGYGEKQVRQMIEIAKKLTDFFKSQSDYPEFEKTALAFQYLAKLNLVTDSYERYNEFLHIFKESDKIQKYIPLHSFSTKGKIRFLMVKYHLGLLFVTLFKIKNFITFAVKK